MASGPTLRELGDYPAFPVDHAVYLRWQNDVYMTLFEFCNYWGALKEPTTQMQRASFGYVITAYCREHSIPVIALPSYGMEADYRHINYYPVVVMKEYFPDDMLDLDVCNAMRNEREEPCPASF